jgi:hypothetical protein
MLVMYIITINVAIFCPSADGPFPVSVIM